jgi:hypothetical protein
MFTFEEIKDQGRNSDINSTTWTLILDVNKNRKMWWIKRISWDIALSFQNDDPDTLWVTEVWLTLDSTIPVWEFDPMKTWYVWKIWWKVASWTWTVEYLDWWKLW